MTDPLKPPQFPAAPLPPLTAGGGGIFSPENLQRHVDAQLATIPDGHTLAGIGYFTIGPNGQKTWHVAIAKKIGDSWSIGGTFDMHSKQDMSGGIIVQWSK